MAAARNKVDTLDRILNAAHQEFAVKGVDGAHIENIAKKANVTKQLIHHYFKTKDQLYKATLDYVSEGMQILDDEELYKQMEPEESICFFVNKLFDEYITHDSYAALTLDQALHQGEHITKSSRFIPNTQSFIIDTVKPILDRGMAQGVFRQGLDHNMVYWMIFNLSTASFLNGKVMSETTGIHFTEEEGREAWRQAVIDFVLNALLAPTQKA